MKFCLRLLALIIAVQSFAFSQNGQKIHISGTRLWINELQNFEPVGTFPVLKEKKGKAEIVFTETSESFTELWDLSHEPSQSAVSETRRDSIIDTTSSNRRAVVIVHRLQGLIDPQGITILIYVCGDSEESFSVTLAYPDSSAGEVRNVLATIVSGLDWRKSIETDPLEQHDFTLKTLNEYVPVSKRTTEVTYTPYGLEIDSTESFPYYTVKSLFSRWTDLRPQEKKQYFEYVLKTISPWIQIQKVAEHGQITLDGVDGYQAVASGYNEMSDTTVHVCLTVLFHPSGFIGLIGIAPEKDHEKAIERFKEITGSFERIRFTGNADSVCMRLLESKQYARAEKCYNAALQKDSTSVPAALGTAAALMGLEKYQEAISLYGRLIDKNDNLDSAYVGRAQAFMKLRRYRDAIDDYNRAIDLNNDSVLYYAGRGEAKEKYGNGQGAAQDYEQAIDMSPRTVKYYLAYAEAMLSAAENVKAEKMLKRALLVDSTDGSIYRLLGDALTKRSEYTEALFYYNKAEEYGDKTLALYLNRSEVKWYLDNVADALNDANAACRITKKSKAAFSHRGEYNLFLGRLTDAVSDFSVKGETRSSDQDMTFYRGVAYLLLKKYKEAAADFRKSATVYAARVLLYLAERESYNETAAQKNLMLYRNSLAANNGDCRGYLAARYALHEITADEFIEQSRQNIEAKKITPYGVVRKSDLGMAYFIVGIMEYSSGLKIGSRKSFEQCMNTLPLEDEIYQLAKAMLKDSWQ